MSAPNCIAFYGIRREVKDDDVEALELRDHPLLQLARAHRLQHYWGAFGDSERMWLFSGRKIAMLGPEDEQEAVVRPMI